MLHVTLLFLVLPAIVFSLGGFSSDELFDGLANKDGRFWSFYVKMNGGVEGHELHLATSLGHYNIITTLLEDIEIRR